MAFWHILLGSAHCWVVPPSGAVAGMQTPIMHAMFAPQTTPHLPQFWLSYIGSEQYCFMPAGSVQISLFAGQMGGGGGGGIAPQVPLKQFSFGAQALPQRPQFPRSLSRFVQSGAPPAPMQAARPG